MNHTEIIQLFLSYVRTSLNQDIQNVYFALRYWEETQHMLPADQEFKEYLERYHERVFCYELYHQLRTRMQRDLEAFPGIFLQSEVIKEKLPPKLREHFGVENLEKDYMPDFILHSPGNFGNQLVVMEVKSNPRIRHDAIFYDLMKIAEFIQRFRYEQGVFVSVNTNPDEIFQLIFEQGDQYGTIPEAVKSQIIIMVQDMPSKYYAELRLIDLCG